jgi:hypothetical protein
LVVRRNGEGRRVLPGTRPYRWRGRANGRERQDGAWSDPDDARTVIRLLTGAEPVGRVTLTSFTQPAHGIVRRGADDTLSYKPDPRFLGTDSFDYMLVDEAGTMFPATVTIEVTQVVNEDVAPERPRHLPVLDLTDRLSSSSRPTEALEPEAPDSEPLEAPAPEAAPPESSGRITGTWSAERFDDDESEEGIAIGVLPSGYDFDHFARAVKELDGSGRKRAASQTPDRKSH